MVLDAALVGGGGAMREMEPLDCRPHGHGTLELHRDFSKMSSVTVSTGLACCYHHVSRETGVFHGPFAFLISHPVLRCPAFRFLGVPI